MAINALEDHSGKKKHFSLYIAGSRPLDKGGPGLQTKVFRPFGSQFGLKIREARPPGPSPGSANVIQTLIPYFLE